MITRTLFRGKPKAKILEDMTRKVFSETDDETIIVTMKPNKVSRSIKQNKLYWKWMTELEDTGNDRNAMHFYLAEEYLGCEFAEVQGKTVKIVPSTTKLGVKEFSEYLLKVDIFAQDLGIVLSHPEDLYYDSIVE